MPTVLIGPEVFFQAPGPHVDMLKKAGFEVRYPGACRQRTEDETIGDMQGACAVLAGGEYFTERVLAALPDLRVIARAGVGYDRVSVDAATKRGVAVTITPNANHEAVAEFTFALLLDVTKHVARQDRELRRGLWTRKPLQPLRGHTLGIVGLGRIGRSVAVRAAAFRMKVLACEKFPDQAFIKSQGIELVDLDTLLARSDIVTLHAPLNDETRGLINRRTLDRMKPGSFLINTARGGLVVEKDLLAALQSGHLAGAGLDVFEVEPATADNPLFQLDNIVVTPHRAGGDRQSDQDMGTEAAQCIINLSRNIWPEGSVVNAQLKAGWKW